MRRCALGLLAAVLAVAVLSGCASTAVTATRLNASVGPTFERMYRWKQKLEGESTAKPLDTTASCRRPTNGSIRHEGAGGEWICTIRFLIDGPKTQVSFNWDVSAKPNGCWAADGAPAAMGGQTIIDTRGRHVVDPIYTVDGCFSPT